MPTINLPQAKALAAKLSNIDQLNKMLAGLEGQAPEVLILIDGVEVDWTCVNSEDLREFIESQIHSAAAEIKYAYNLDVA